MQNLIGTVLSLVSNRNNFGYDIGSSLYFQSLKSHFKANFCAPKRSAICEARDKISWQAFQYLLEKLNTKTKFLEKDFHWKKHNVYAVDGSWIDLPRTDKIISKFPLRKTACNRGHYPKGKLVSALNVFTGIPKAAYLDKENSSERNSLYEILDQFSKGSILLLDRGYEGASTVSKLTEKGLQFVMRVKSSVESRTTSRLNKFFLNDSQTSQILDYEIVDSKGNPKTIKVRFIRAGIDRKGNEIVLITSLLNGKKYKSEKVWKLYLKRWNIETKYYRMKEQLKLENFRSKKLNGVLQELWANMFLIGIVSSMISCCLLGKPIYGLKRINFKNAHEQINKYIDLLVHKISRRRWKKIYDELIESIQAITFIHQPGRTNERISRRPQMNWQGGRKNRAITRWESKKKSP